MVDIIPSGSLQTSGWEISTPDWAKPTIWLPVDVGCLAKVLPLGGPTWMNELVIVLQEIDDIPKKSYRVAGRFGETVLPYYALDVQSYKSEI